jgi:thiol-disulfide isomerase/thioredoxin
MSKISRFALAAAGVLWCLCAIVPAVRGEDDLWQTDFEAAKAKAKAENKLLLVDFTGSDWCPWCIKLHGEVFDKDEFKSEAPKHFILVELDFPNKKKLSDEVKEQNQKLQKQYKIQGYPTVLLLDAEGQVVAHTGYQAGGPDKYNEQLSGFLTAYDSIVKMKEQLAKAKGLGRAKLLDKLVDVYANKLHNEIDELNDWSKEIVKLDANNKAGLRSKHQFRLCIAESDKLLEDHQLAEANEALEKALAIDGLGAAQKRTAQAKIDRLKPILEAQEAVVKLKAELQSAKGLDRAKLLDELIDAQKKLVQFIPRKQAMQAIQDIRKWSKEIVDLDVNNEAGLKTKYGFQVKLMEVFTQAQKGALDKARAALDEAEALPDLTDQQKATIEQIRNQLPKAKAKTATKAKPKAKSDDEN